MEQSVEYNSGEKFKAIASIVNCPCFFKKNIPQEI